MNKKEETRIKVALALPLLLFIVLPIPYSFLNQKVLVNWLGCGCPKVDESGNMIDSYFNANDFTALFWLLVTVGATAWAVFLARRIPKKLMWLRILYIAGIFTCSLCISYFFTQSMMWN